MVKNKASMIVWTVGRVERVRRQTRWRGRGCMVEEHRRDGVPCGSVNGQGMESCLDFKRNERLKPFLLLGKVQSSGYGETKGNAWRGRNNLKKDGMMGCKAVLGQRLMAMNERV